MKAADSSFVVAEPPRPFLSLAPMEGVMDWVFRDLITSFGGVDRVTTEFIRVTHNLHPHKVFYRYAHELHSGGRTRSGTPLFIQLLGGQVEPMALNAVRATELGALGIDLNFGCPAKTVNRHDGGASLLKNPHRLYDISAAVRKAVPAATPVTAKIRLGFDDTSLCLENAKALHEAGASAITVHCRTKREGYKPPARWEWLARIREQVDTPLIANGDIADIDSLKRCQDISGCRHFMIGRAALRNPKVFLQIRSESPRQTDWSFHRKMLLGFYDASRNAINAHFAMARTKQFLRNLTLDSDEAQEVFQATKALLKPVEFETKLAQMLQ